MLALFFILAAELLFLENLMKTEKLDTKNLKKICCVISDNGSPWWEYVERKQQKKN